MRERISLFTNWIWEKPLLAGTPFVLDHLRGPEKSSSSDSWFGIPCTMFIVELSTPNSKRKRSVIKAGAGFSSGLAGGSCMLGVPNSKRKRSVIKAGAGFSSGLAGGSCMLGVPNSKRKRSVIKAGAGFSSGLAGGSCMLGVETGVS